MSPTFDRRLAARAGALTALAGLAAVAQVRHMRRIARDPEQAVLRNPPSGRALTVHATDGTELHAELFGPNDGATIVLAHGWTETIRMWTYVIPELTRRGFRVVAYDLRGHGQSGASPENDYSLERFGDDLEAVLAETVPEGQRAVVAGHSLGAMSIAAWAEHHDVERRAGAAALLNTGFGDLIAQSLLFPLPHALRAATRPLAVRGFVGSRAPLPRFSTPISYAAVRYAAFARGTNPARVAFYERMLIASTPDVRASVGIALSTMDLYDAVPRIAVPTLVMAGADDKLTPPSQAERIADALPRLIKLVVLPKTAHMGPLERPREVSEALTELAGLVAANPQPVTA